MKSFQIQTLGVVALLSLVGCGYGLATSKSSVMEDRKIRTVYVQPIRNDSFKSGAENVVYNEVIRMILTTKTLRLVDRPAEADVYFWGVVRSAGYKQNGADRLAGVGVAGDDPGLRFIPQSVAKRYSANLDCSFRLERRKASSDQKKVVWSAILSRSHDFPANNYLGVQGSTSALLNDSEFDRALRENARNMAGDIYQSMLSKF